MVDKGQSSFTLNWREGKKAPCSTFRLFDSVADGDTFYLKDDTDAELYSYTAHGGWVSLPECPWINGSGLVVINHLLTAVGGNKGTELTDKLFSLTRKCCSKKWTEVFPPMPTKRRQMTVHCTGRFLIVAGGITFMSWMLTTVEVMNIEIRQWYTAAALPDPTTNFSAAVCGDQIYMLGGDNKYWKESASVYTCSLSALLKSCSSPSDQSSVWSRVADCPAKSSTCVSLHGRMLAIGGRDYDGKLATSAVFMYNPATDSWSVVSHMLSPRNLCCATVLHDNQVMVVAGKDTNFKSIDTVELGRVKC